MQTEIQHLNESRKPYRGTLGRNGKGSKNTALIYSKWRVETVRSLGASGKITHFGFCYQFEPTKIDWETFHRCDSFCFSFCSTPCSISSKLNCASIKFNYSFNAFGTVFSCTLLLTDLFESMNCSKYYLFFPWHYPYNMQSICVLVPSNSIFCCIFNQFEFWSSSLRNSSRSKYDEIFAKFQRRNLSFYCISTIKWRSLQKMIWIYAFSR